jgi:hypothetical protein
MEEKLTITINGHSISTENVEDLITIQVEGYKKLFVNYNGFISAIESKANKIVNFTNPEVPISLFEKE